jgi:hypothetical protein
MVSTFVLALVHAMEDRWRASARMTLIRSSGRVRRVGTALTDQVRGDCGS